MAGYMKALDRFEEAVRAHAFKGTLCDQDEIEAVELEYEAAKHALIIKLREAIVPRINLTDEEARHIEQRRLMENKFNLGFNEALNTIQSYLFDLSPTDLTKANINEFIQTQKRIIRP